MIKFKKFGDYAFTGKPLQLACRFGVIVSVAVLAFSGMCDTRAMDSVDSAFKRSLVAFASVRGLNAVISAAQGTEVSVSPLGMGLTLAPGEVLDPLNDLIERFSGFMLVSTVALGSQRVLLEISAWKSFSVVLVVLGALLLFFQALSSEALNHWKRRLWRIFLILAVVRFVMPLAIIGSEWMYDGFLQTRHTQAEIRMTQAADRIRAMNVENESLIKQGTESGSWEKFKDWANNTKVKASSAIDFDGYSETLKNSVRDAIDLMVVFFLYTLLFPILIIFLLWRLTRWVIK